MKLFLVEALTYLPLSLPCGILCFAAARWGLERKGPRIRQIVRVCLLIGLALLAAGMIYGLLRYCGVLVFPDDDFSSVHFFDSSGGDEGFQYLYVCGIISLQGSWRPCGRIGRRVVQPAERCYSRCPFRRNQS